MKNKKLENLRNLRLLSEDFLNSENHKFSDFLILNFKNNNLK